MSGGSSTRDGAVSQAEAFVSDFESALDAHRRLGEESSLIAAARRQASQLASTLARLSSSLQRATIVTPEDLRALDDDLAAIEAPPPLDTFARNAGALLQLIDSGIIGGDATRLRELLAEATSLSSNRPRPPRPGQTYLDVPARALCVDCDKVLVGRRKAGRNWNAMTKSIRDHERDHHGGYTTVLRDALTDGLRGLRQGKATVTAGRYQIGDVPTEPESESERAEGLS